MRILLSFILLSPCLLFSHPHTFIDVYAEINSSKNVQNIIFKWKFDEMTSQLLVMEFDANMDGKLDNKEIEYIKINYFETLEQYNYYTDIIIQNNSIKTKPLNFTAYIEDNIKVVYQFEIEIQDIANNITLNIYDEERFSALVLKKEFITSNTKYKLTDIDTDLYFGYKLELQ